MPSRCLRLVSLSVACLAASPLAHALLTFNDGKDQIYVTSTYSFGYDTNVFAQKIPHGAATQAWSFEADYSRHAGIIQVSASATMNLGAFAGLAGQDYIDPGVTVDFSKGTGRTTGDLSLGATRTNAPDTSANDRAIAWNYDSTLKLRYPINERFYLTNVAGANFTSYTNTQVFADQESYTDGFGVNVIYDSKLDLNAMYNVGWDQTHDTSALTQSVTLGADGTVLPKLTGSVDVGLSHDATYYTHPHFPSSGFDALDANANLIWRFSRDMTFEGTVSRNLGIASTDIGDEVTTFTIGNDTSLGKKLRLHLAVDYIPTVYIGRNSLGRKDYLWEFLASLQTAITTHWRVAVSYIYMINYSNLSTARFTRQTVSFSVTVTY